MDMKAFPLLTLACALPLLPAPAMACSASRTAAPTAAERVEGRTDLRRVVGTYRMERVDRPESHGAPGLVRGRVTTRRGSSYPVVQPYWGIWIECGVYDLPLSDASGIFYLKRRAQGGVHELVDWSGRHIPGSTLPGLANGTEEGPQ